MENNNPLEVQSKKPAPFKKENFFFEILKFALIAALIVLPIRFFVAQPFIVNGQSMEPTFENGEYLIVNEISYRFENPKRGDVLIFKYPYDKTKYYIKRIIGLPSETIEISGTQVKITNDKNPNGFILNEPYIKFPKDWNEKITLKSDEYFVMGDNRPDSYDSRSWGPLNKSFIIGTPLARLLPFNKISLFPGDYNFSQ